MSRYAWKITDDHLFEPDLTDADGSLNEAGITGPSAAPPELLARLEAGEGREFKMYDDDGELYYSGRIIVQDREGTAWTDAEGGEEDFGPLWDFGTPNAGCTAIKYKRAPFGVWETL